MTFFESLHTSWQIELRSLSHEFELVEDRLRDCQFLPKRELVMRALSTDVSELKVVILGQDPYPRSGDAVGLAFAIDESSARVPASLNNIVKEYQSDLGKTHPGRPSLQKWQAQGVLLLNRTLTVREGEPNSHVDLGWQLITERVVEVLAKRGCVGILWGNKAQELSNYFNPEDRIESAHPSPLSAHRGFFGSRPFSRCNARLAAKNVPVIDWSL